jgi:hypothetical protein
MPGSAADEERSMACREDHTQTFGWLSSVLQISSIHLMAAPIVE